MASCGAYLEKLNALQDVQNIVAEYGYPIRIYLDTESGMTRDKYNSIEKRETTDTERILDIRAYPLNFSPTTRDIEKAGLKEKAEVICYTAMKDWTDRGYNFKDLNITKATAEVRGDTYLIKDKAENSQYLDEFLYITLGLFRK